MPNCLLGTACKAQNDPCDSFRHHTFGFNVLSFVHSHSIILHNYTIVHLVTRDHKTIFCCFKIRFFLTEPNLSYRNSHDRRQNCLYAEWAGRLSVLVALGTNVYLC